MFNKWWDKRVCTDVDDGIDNGVVAKLAWNEAIKSCQDRLQVVGRLAAAKSLESLKVLVPTISKEVTDNG